MGRARARAGGGTRGSGGPADDAHGQAHQCGFPDRSLNPPGQHHGAWAGKCAAGILAPAGSDRDRAAAVTAPDDDDSRGADGGQEARSQARPGAGPACARAWGAGRCRAGGR